MHFYKALRGYSEQLLKCKQITLIVYFGERSRSGSSASSSVFLEKDKLSELLMSIYQWELTGASHYYLAEKLEQE